MHATVTVGIEGVTIIIQQSNTVAEVANHLQQAHSPDRQHKC